MGQAVRRSLQHISSWVEYSCSLFCVEGRLSPNLHSDILMVSPNNPNDALQLPGRAHRGQQKQESGPGRPSSARELQAKVSCRL